jgi:hypothetical protein
VTEGVRYACDLGSEARTFSIADRFEQASAGEWLLQEGRVRVLPAIILSIGTYQLSVRFSAWPISQGAELVCEFSAG